MVQKININQFLTLSRQYPVIDVRSPGEHNHAHIPGAYNIPLFTDEERKVVGTIYKQEGREAAIKSGLQYFGPKMVRMVEEAEELIKNHKSEDATNKSLLVHCWRGGMRSAGVAWLLDLYGFRVCTLSGGYKAFRNWALQQFEKKYPLKIIGGYTGSGKTPVLKELAIAGHKVIDLEDIAKHRGSAFGELNEKQPSQEMFDNLLALNLNDITSIEPKNGIIWLEDESQRIGNLNLPNALWAAMRTTQVYFLDVPFEDRLKHIVAEYGSMNKEVLIKAIGRIQKRLGGLDAKKAISFLEDGNFIESFRILLRYYDKHYDKGFDSRKETTGYKIIFKEKEGYVKCHTDLDTKTSDYLLLENIGIEKAKKGDKVEILPEISTPNDPRRKIIFKGAKENKNPDLRINGRYVEIKEPIPPYGKNSISNIITLAAHQADHVIVNILDDTVSEFYLFRIANGKLHQIRELKSIEFRHRGKYLLFIKKGYQSSP